MAESLTHCETVRLLETTVSAQSGDVERASLHGVEECTEQGA